jgi:hypothetical protein
MRKAAVCPHCPFQIQDSKYFGNIVEQQSEERAVGTRTEAVDEIGLDGWLSKPVNLAEFDAVIDRWFGPQGQMKLPHASAQI